VSYIKETSYYDNRTHVTQPVCIRGLHPHDAFKLLAKKDQQSRDEKTNALSLKIIPQTSRLIQQKQYNEFRRP